VTPVLWLYRRDAAQDGFEAVFDDETLLFNSSP
jgi:hypothetical protein